MEGLRYLNVVVSDARPDIRIERLGYSSEAGLKVEEEFLRDLCNMNETRHFELRVDWLLPARKEALRNSPSIRFFAHFGHARN